MSPTLTLLLRMTLAILVGLLMMRMMKIKLDWRANAVRVYLYSSMSLAVGMLLCYLAAEYISSGLMSLTFGIAPILSGVFGQRLLKEPRFSVIKKSALFIALFGLFIVSQENVSVSPSIWIGVLYILGAVTLFSLSGVLVKSVPVTLHPLCTTVGSLIVSWPLFLLFWWLADGSLDYQSWGMRSVLSTVYLGVFGSLIGFWAYFYILTHLPASTVSLVVMITPVLSTAIGVWLNDEYFSMILMLGGALVVTGLGLFQLGDKILERPQKVTQITN